MVGITSLLLPVFVSAVLVFLVSFVLHMVMKYHRTDFGKVPSEDGVMEALRKFNIPEGEAVDRLVDLIKEHGKWVEANTA